MSLLPIEPDTGLLPAGWCWCGQIWMISGLPDFAEGGLLHRRDACLTPETGQPTPTSPSPTPP